MRTYIHANLHTHIHTHIHPSIHTYIYTYMATSKMAEDAEDEVENALNLVVCTVEQSSNMRKKELSLPSSLTSQRISILMLWWR